MSSTMSRCHNIVLYILIAKDYISTKFLKVISKTVKHNKPTEFSQSITIDNLEED